MSDQIVEESLDKPEDLIRETINFTIEGVDISLATVRRIGSTPPLVCLHGFGGTKEDYIDIRLYKRFRNRSFILYDTPGSGESKCSDYSKVTIPFLVLIAQHVIERFIDENGTFYVLGHSMGGLTSLLLSNKLRDSNRILGFIDIKGNLSPEDCFLSRQIFQYPNSDDESFINDFLERARKSGFFGDSLYASGFRSKVHNLKIVRSTFESMVDISDNQNLLEMFLDLPFPRMFMYGEQFDHLSYLPTLHQADGVELARIEEAGHFVMYSNPIAMWDRIYKFLNDHPW